MVELNGLPMMVWCNAQGVVDLMHTIWGREDEPSEVSLEGLVVGGDSDLLGEDESRLSE